MHMHDNVDRHRLVELDTLSYRPLTKMIIGQYTMMNLSYDGSVDAIVISFDNVQSDTQQSCCVVKCLVLRLGRLKISSVRGSMTNHWLITAFIRKLSSKIA